MEKFKTLPDAIALAEFAHRNQVDKAGFPYIEHPKRVLANVQAMGAAPYVQIAAVLHDVTEDTAFTPQMLLDLGFSPAAVELVKLVDRKESERYHFAADYPDGLHMARMGSKEQVDYFYYDAIKNNRDAVMIKIADISDNTLQWRLSYLPEKDRNRLTAKYEKALKILNS